MSGILFLLGACLLWADPFGAPSAPTGGYTTVKGIFDGYTNMLPSDNTIRNVVHEAVNETTYIVGPGDVLNIQFLGNVLEEDIKAQVNPEGNLVIPHIGIVHTQKPLKEVKEDIMNLLGVKAKKGGIIVQLYAVKTVMVSVSGMVDRPGTYEFNSTVRLSDAVMKAMDSKTYFSDLPKASLRNIAVVSQDGNQRTYDFSDFLFNGDIAGNPFLFPGDRVIVHARTCSLAVGGAVVKPGIYDYRQESLFDLLMFGGGLLPQADSGQISVISYKDNGASLETQNFSFPDACKSYTVRPFDHVVVATRPFPSAVTSISLLGRVRNPGIYNVQKGTTVRQAIKIAGGLLEDADPEVIYVSRVQFFRNFLAPGVNTVLPEHQRTNAQILSADFPSPPGSRPVKVDYSLEDGDLLFVPRQISSVSVVGNVLRPGIVPYEHGLHWEDYIRMAGGFDKNAMKGRTKIFKKKSAAWIYVKKVETINAGDIIFVPEIPMNYYWDRIKDAITITSGIVSLTVTVLLLSKNAI